MEDTRAIRVKELPKMIKKILTGNFIIVIDGHEDRKAWFDRIKPYMEDGTIVKTIVNAPRDGRIHFDLYHIKSIKFNKKNYWVGHSLKSVGNTYPFLLYKIEN
jgi:hypothetical protein